MKKLSCNNNILNIVTEKKKKKAVTHWQPVIRIVKNNLHKSRNNTRTSTLLKHEINKFVI